MARRKDHTRDQIRDLILDAAWRIVETDGADGLTARRIGEEIGYAAGTIYNIFPSMTDIHLYINGRTLDLLYERLALVARRGAGKETASRLRIMARGYIAFSRDFRPFWTALFSGGLEEKPAWYKRKIESMFGPLESIMVQSGFENARQDAQILWSSVHGLVYLWSSGKLPAAGRGKKVLEDMVDRLIDLYLIGLRGEATSPEVPEF